MGPATLHLVLKLGLVALLLSLPIAPVVAYFARHLSFSKSYLVTVIAMVVAFIFQAGYVLAQTRLNFPNEIDGLAALIGMLLFGDLVTRLVRRYGIPKTGWVGVGGKTILVSMGFSWAAIGVVFAVHALTN